MNALLVHLNELSAPWADVMWAVAWQGTLLAIAAAGVCWALRRQSPGLRYWIWLILAAKLITLPLWSVDVAAPTWLVRGEPTAATGESPVGAPIDAGASAAAFGATSPAGSIEKLPPTRGAVVAEAAAPAWHRRAAWATWLMLGWALVAAFEVGRTAWQFVRLRMLLARTTPVDRAVEEIVAQCAETLGLARAPETRRSDAESSPLVCGLLRPVLLLPRAHDARFDAASLRQIVLHELAHVRRWDLWTVWVIHAMRTIYWFNPLAHWIAYRAGLDRELACDELAMSHSGASAATYARTLIDAAGRRSQPMALSAAGAARLDGGQGPMGDR